VLLL
jgi:hypothetical protein